MIYMIIKSYLAILLAIGIGATFIFLTGFFFILKYNLKQGATNKSTTEHDEPSSQPNSQNLNTSPISNVEAAIPLVKVLSVMPTAISKKAITITSKDINAIAGNDILATQLDLARAYIETGRNQLAKKILEHVEKKGTVAQQREAINLKGLIHLKHVSQSMPPHLRYDTDESFFLSQEVNKQREKINVFSSSDGLSE